MAYRKLDKLTNQFRRKVELFIEEVWNTVFVTESYRSQERQQKLYEQWRYWNPWPIVTWTTSSEHTKGRAIDIAFLWRELYPSDISKWKEIGEIANNYGISWGWDLWKTDKPHFQDNWQPLEYKKSYEEIENENTILRKRAKEATEKMWEAIKILNPNW